MSRRAAVGGALLGGLVLALVEGARLGQRQGYGALELAPALAQEALLGALVLVLPALILGRWLRSGWAFAGLGGLAGLAVGLAVRAPEASPGPALGSGRPGGARTVVLVTGDTLRRDHVSAYPGALAHTPNLEALAADGLRFDEAMSTAPLTLASHTSMLTGRLPAEHGLLRNGLVLEGAPSSAPALLAAAGYQTGAFVSSSVLHGAHGLSRFFGVYRDDLGPQPGARDLFALRALSSRERRPPVQRQAGALTVSRALDWLNRLGPDQPAMLWVHLYDPHGPHAPGPSGGAPGLPPPCDYAGHPAGLWRQPDGVGVSALQVEDCRQEWSALESQVSAYARDVGVMDAAVGALIAGIKASGRWEDTALVFAGDHGESLTEHQQWVDHQYVLYDTALRVPLILRLPPSRREALAGGVAVAAPVSTARIGATLITLAGLPPDPDFCGPDLLQVAQGAPAVSADQVAVAFTPGLTPDGRAGVELSAVARLDGRASLVSASGRRERYDLRLDPGQRSPLIRPDEAEALAAKLRGLDTLVRGPVPVSALPSLMRRGALTERPASLRQLDASALGSPMSETQAAEFAAVDALAERALAAATRAWSSRSSRPGGLDPALPADVVEALEALGYLR